jgi:anti-sigma factor ChrR (cupin superfamily)
MSAHYQVPESLHADRRRPVVVHAESLDWTPSPLAGVERRFLEREGAEVARATSIVRYAPGSRFSEHVHEMGEEYFVLSGVFSDQSGDFPEGTYVRNPPGSRHAPFTVEGCTIFVKLRQMVHAEQLTLEKRAQDSPLLPTEIEGLSRACLFEMPGLERVFIEQLQAGALWDGRDVGGGEEILVLDGVLNYGTTVCPPMTWLRIPQMDVQALLTPLGCRFWVKRGHLPS